MPLLSVNSVDKSFGTYRALQSVELEVQHGEFIAMLGPSGCGKTTLLRSIAGFLLPDAGRIVMDGQDVTGLPPNKRPVNTVFQSYALFPHMRIIDNVAYGPRRKGASSRDAAGQAREALEMVGLGEFGERFPRQLSGGQQQRVALARALVNKPKLLLLDEPLSALDAKLRKQMQIELKRLQQKLGISFVFVTHDQEEAMAMADRIVVMNKGCIEQIGDGQTIYSSPRTRFVADFVGEANFIPCTRTSDGNLKPAIGTKLIRSDAQHRASTVMLRPEHLCLVKEPAPDLSTFSATVEEVLNLGPYSTVVVECVGHQVSLRCPTNSQTPTKGSSVIVGYAPENAIVVMD
jgi:spermidine/putrescine transport system ATP-binding protein